MKIRVMDKDYEEVCRIIPEPYQKPVKPSRLLRILIRILSEPELRKVHFTFEEHGMEQLGEKEPCLILMNHSSFIDLKIAANIFRKRPYQIVMTSDGFVGKNELMRRIGCIPTKKFITDITLIRDMKYSLEQLQTSVLLYPEASYSFDGTATPLPDSLAKCLKLLGVPVIMVRTNGAFLRDPLYNNLQVRKTDVSAVVSYLFSPEDIKQKSAEELQAVLNEQFTFDNFRFQQEHQIKISEPFRADHLERVLYKCPSCHSEKEMVGKGTRISCSNCRKEYELTEFGYMEAVSGITEFAHIPDWYQWERECVRREISDGEYHTELEVAIGMIVDRKAVYRVGSGTLIHSEDGFSLRGCDGKLEYHQKPEASYSLYSDYYWYEIGDVVCIGNQKALYYCFPMERSFPVAKLRLAAEELFKMKEKQKKKR